MKKLLLCAAIAGLFVASCSAMESAKDAFTGVVKKALEGDNIVKAEEVASLVTTWTEFVKAFTTDITTKATAAVNKIKEAKTAEITALRTAVGTANEQLTDLTKAMANALSNAAKELGKEIEKIAAPESAGR